MGRSGHRACAGVIDELRRIAGGDAVHAPQPGEWMAHGHAPHAVVQPESAEAAAAVLALCSEQGWSVEPAGAGTWLDHGRAGARPYDVVLSTRGLAQRIDTEPGDLVVGVDAGVTLGKLGQRLARDRQELPLDPIGAATATLGAIVSLAAAGPLRAGAGTPRDYVLGLQVATGDGRLLRFGGRVVKNVAGYDVVRLLTGSRGTLGLITGMWLRLRALPAADRTFVLDGTLGEILQVIAGLRSVRPAAVEVLTPATAATVSGGAAWKVLLRLRGSREELGDAAVRLRGLVAGLSLTETDGEVWRRLDAAEAGAPLVIRVAGLPGSLSALVALCQDFIMASGNELQDWHGAAHGTAGIVRLWPVRRVAPEQSARLAAALLELRKRAEAAGGSVLMERAGPELQALVPARGTVDPVTRRLETELKRVMDPAGILGRLA